MENEQEKLPLFTRLNDAIEGKLNQFTDSIARAAEEKPGFGTDDLVRGGLQGLSFIGNLPVIKQIGQLEEGIVGGVRDLAECQNLIDPRSFSYSARIGTMFIPYSGATKLAKSGLKTKLLTSIGDIGDTSRSIFNIAKEAPSGRMFGVTAGGEGIKGGGKFINPTKKNLEFFNKIGFTGTNKLDIQTMLYGIDDAGKPAMSQYVRRAIKAGIANETFDWGQFNKTRKVLVKDYLDGLQDLKIDPKTIHAHHISALRVTASLFDGLSPIQRKKLLKTFQKEGLAIGNSPKNLMALHKSVHLDVVHPFLEKQLGKYGQLLLDPNKMKKLNPRQREGLVKKFANIIKHSEEVALEASRTWLDDAFTGATPDQALMVKLDMLDSAFNERVRGLRLLKNKLDTIGPYLPYMVEDAPIPEILKTRVRKKSGKKLLDRLLKPYDKDQLTIWDIDPETFSKSK